MSFSSLIALLFGVCTKYSSMDDVIINTTTTSNNFFIALSIARKISSRLEDGNNFPIV